MGLVEIAGYYSNLKRGFDEIGIESVFVDLSGHPFKYNSSTPPNFLVKLAMWIGKKRVSTSRTNLLIRMWWAGLQEILMIPLFIWAVTKYDTFIFGFSSGFFRYHSYDLPILKWLNKRIIYVFHGSDSRPVYLDGGIMATGSLTVETCIKLTHKQKRQLQKIERYANIIVSHPLSAQLHEKKFVPFLLMGLPYNIRHTSFPLEQILDHDSVRLLHSPSYPEAKGTFKIREVIQNLQAKGYLIEFIEVTGKPNAIVLNELAKCDFVIDQLYSDTPMAGFAAEAALFGKPAVVGGYGQTEFERTIPSDRLPPSHYCYPDELETAIEKLILDKPYRLEVGQRARQFVETYWTPKQVAQRFLHLIKGDIPEAWQYDPQDIRYLHGWALSEARTRQLVRAIIETGGKEALQLTDKPELERMFIEFAGLETT